MQIWIIIIESVLAASSSVLIICSIGAFLYRNGKIDDPFIHKLSGLIERVFLPSLIVTNFIKSVTLDQFWIVLPSSFAALLVCLVGWMVGYFSNKILIKDDRYGQIVNLACANPHTTNIQLQVSYGLALLLGDLTKHVGFESTQDAGARAITSVMMFTAINNTFRWTLGKSILLKFANEQRNYESLIEMQPPPQMTKRPSQIHIQTKPQQPKPETQTSWRSYVSMPLLSILGAYIIILIPPLQQMLLDREHFLNRSVYASFYTIGRATPPAVLIMLGANIASIIKRGGFKEGQSISKRTLTLITFSRLVILPMVGLPLTLLMGKIEFLQDPCDMFITFFTFATPSAINIIVQAKQYTDYEDVVAVILVYSYTTAIITLPIWSMIFFFIMFQ